MESNAKSEPPLWKTISEKLKPFLTRDDFIHLDKERYVTLIKRLKSIQELSEREYNYANINRDLILIRMGLIHTLPDVTDDMLETILKQLAVHLATIYYENNVVKSWREAEEKVMKILNHGFSSAVTMGLTPESHLEILREYINNMEKITIENISGLIEEINKAKDNLMQAGISGVILHNLTKFAQKLKRAKEEELPTKHEIIEETYAWQEKIKKV
ncbi:MAG: hypothetical protein ACTSQE_13350 [Candidatus Heimdallarchaeaceae archaeon]